MNYKEINKSGAVPIYDELMVQYNALKDKKMKLDMSRGKPGADQLDLSMGMVNILKNIEDFKTEAGFDVRNYGLLDGIPEAKELFAAVLEVSPEQVIVGGSSSLNLMYDVISKGMTHGYGGQRPWSAQGEIKFLCPTPGYDRHFGVTQSFGIKLIPVEMTASGPNMESVEKLVSDPQVKGIWCVPKYSNPDGITYSDDTVKRFAKLKPAAKDFIVMWDNAYAVHDLDDEGDKLLSIHDECAKEGSEDMVFQFCSTSKVTFPGSGVSAMSSSKKTIDEYRGRLKYQTISYNKINQLRHVKYLRSLDGIKSHMKKHSEILKPKFDIVCDALDSKLVGDGYGSYIRPVGGYFVSYYAINGTAKRTIELCKEAGVAMTPAGAAYPYGNDPEDSNIRIAPTFPSNSDLKAAVEIFCVAAKIAAMEKIINS